MAERKHALLSASGSHRWLVCHPSPRLEEEIPEVQSDYADEGTLAHKLGEWLIREKIYKIDVSSRIAKLKEDKWYSEEMMSYCEDYAEFVKNLYEQAPPGSIIIQEQKLWLTDYIPEGFGTVDNCIVGGNVLRIVDLKYGKGVPVDAYENEQLMTYGLGALEEYCLLYDIKSIVLTIYQPRIDNYSEYEVTPEHLRRWGNEVLKPAARKAYQGVGELIAGDHCRWCRYKPVCAAYAKLNLQLAQREFDVTKLTDDQISKILQKGDQITKWVGAVKEYAMREALKGKVWPGMKLVYGRSNRKYTDEKAIAAALEAEGFKSEEVVNKKLIGVTEMSKKLSKLQFERCVEPYIIKPEGRPTLAVDADKRPMIDRAAEAAAEFEDIE